MNRHPVAALALLVAWTWAADRARAQAVPEPSPAPPGETARTITVNGFARRFYLFWPGMGPDSGPIPLVVVLHGAGGDAAGFARHTGFTRLAEREGFAVVYPEGRGRRWNDGRGLATASDDVAFIRALLDSLRRELGVDPRRIYATGISNGAMFTHRLACDLPGTFAAIAPVAGALPAAVASRCPDSAAVSLAAFQGSADPLLPLTGGEAGPAGRRGVVLSARRTAEFWAGRDGCPPTPEASPEPDRAPRDRTRVVRSAWGGCRAGRAVVLYTIEGGGHTWPGGPPVGARVGRVTLDLSATPTIWEFFKRHPKP